MSVAALNQALELVQQNNPESLERALGLLQNTVYSFGMKVCGHPQDAEDTMQEVLIKSLPYLAKFESPKALSVWLYRVARNRCLMNRRGAKNARHKHLSLDQLMPSHAELQELTYTQARNPESALLHSENAQHLREALNRVSPLYRMILVLHDMEGLNTAEVAEVTKLREGTVRVRLHRGRLMLRRELERLARAKGKVVHTILASADEGPKPRTASCRKMFAELSDYVDGLLDDARRREMDRHLDGCQPCIVFLSSLRSAVAQCRLYEPNCNPERAQRLRQQLLEQHQAAVAALSHARK